MGKVGEGKRKSVSRIVYSAGETKEFEEGWIL
jgi:hypothetical protein